jgi:hypothetical protein
MLNEIFEQWVLLHLFDEIFKLMLCLFFVVYDIDPLLLRGAAEHKPLHLLAWLDALPQSCDSADGLFLRKTVTVKVTVAFEHFRDRLKSFGFSLASLLDFN